MSDTSTQPVTLSIHGAPHALPAVVNAVSHAHVADLHYLLTTETGIPVGTQPLVGYVRWGRIHRSCCPWTPHLRNQSPAVSMGHLTPCPPW